MTSLASNARAILLCLFALAFLGIDSAFANIPGGGTGTGANVTLTDNGTTVTISNGIVSIVVTKASATIYTIKYTYNNGGTTVTNPVLAGGDGGGGGQLYWNGNPASFGTMNFTYSLIANTGTYAEISLVSTSATNGVMEVDYSMLKGSTGFYTTAMLTHRSTDGIVGVVLRPNIYAGAQFNWMSVDAVRNKLMEVSDTSTTIAVPNAPKECYMWTNGIYQGRYDDKYKYSADMGVQPEWGWSSVGASGSNVGIWNISGTEEYYPGGPLNRSLMEHIGTTILNVFTGGYYGFSTDNNIQSGEVWSKVYGPYFYYFNNVSTSITDPVQASQALYSDARTQAAAEQSAWPYSWYPNSNYVQASGRGTVTGKIVISDTGNPNASAANLWVGVVQQPSTTYDTVYDFQEWVRPYEFWTQADANGNFTIPNVIAGSNYTLYAFGSGAIGTFMSQTQTGGSPPILYNLPASPFSVTVTGGTTTSVGTVTWTPSRVGSTVFEIGYPDRAADKFRHGDDYWIGDIGPSPTSPSPVWTKFYEYPFDFPNGPNYTVGSSRWSTDWNFIQPAVLSTAGVFQNSSSNINFTLPSGTSLSGKASLYLGLASDYYAAIVVTVNGTNMASLSGLAATPTTSVPTTGYYTGYGASDTSIREGNNGAFSDERLTFSASALKTGTNVNTINIGIRQIGGAYFANHAMYDYVRLELAGYVPPAPASVSGYAGNGSILLRWPVTPGAIGYNISRTTTSGTNYQSIASGVTGPVCGSGMQNATWLDTTATNGTTYYYAVQSADTTGTSARSPQSTGIAASSSAATVPPAAPTSVTATPGSGQVGLSWIASPNANYYTVQRSTLAINGGSILGGLTSGTEGYFTLSTITLTNTDTGTSYTDSTPTNGSTYSYTVTPVNASGTGSASTAVNAVPIATAPAAAPTVAATSAAGQITLNWNAVNGAVGYVIEEATSPGGPYTYVASIQYLTYTITGLAANTPYYFIVAANNSGGASAESVQATATTPLAPPTSLTATPGNAQVTLAWPAVSGAASYEVQRGTATGGPYTAVGTPAGPSYTDSLLTNGTTYFYVVASTNANGTGSNSVQASATPIATVPVAPTGLTAAAGNSLVALNWNASAGATSYSVFRGATTGGPYSTDRIGITGTNFTDTGLTNGVAYYYVVAAASAGGTGAYSNEANATPSANAVQSLVWVGDSVANAWDSASPNWTGSVTGTGTAFSSGDPVTFTDGGSVSPAVNIPGTVSPGSVEVSGTASSYTFSGAGGIGGAGGLQKDGAGALTLASANIYAGATSLNSGTLRLQANSGNTVGGVSSALSLSSTLTQGAGTTIGLYGNVNNTIFAPASVIEPNTSGTAFNLYVANNGSGTGNTLILANVGQFGGAAFGGTVTYNLTGSNGYTLQLGSGAAGTGMLNFYNNTALNSSTPGVTLAIPGGLADNYPLSYTVTFEGAGNTSIGAIVPYSATYTEIPTFAGKGTVTLTGSNTYTGITTVASGNVAVIAGAAIADTSQILVATGSGSGAAIYQSGGLVTNTSTALGGFQIGSAAGAAGYYNISGGAINAAGEIDAGGSGGGAGTFSEFDMSGGTINLPNSSSSYFLLNRGAAGEKSVVNFLGGAVSIAGGATPTDNGLDGLAANWTTNQTATITLSGTAQVIIPSLWVKLNVGTGFNGTGTGGDIAVLNLNGGTLQTLGIEYTGTNSTVNFDGGTIEAGNASNASFMTGLAGAYVYSGGGAINNNGQSITIAQPLLAVSGSGVAAVSIGNGGSGYTAPPAVAFAGGGGKGATAYATVSATGGAVTGIVITNPGTGYTSAPAATLTSVTSGTAATIGTVTMAANAATGGITFSGTGTTALTAVESYTGPTIVNSGTLSIANTTNAAVSGLNTSSSITINNGATININATTDNALLGSVPGTTASLTINTGGTLTTSDSSHLGPLIMAGGTLAENASPTTDQAAWGVYDLDHGVTAGGTPATSIISALDIGLSESGGTIFNVSPGASNGVDLDVTGGFSHLNLEGNDNGLIKTGNGVMLLAGASNYSSATTVSGGTLEISGSVATSSVAVGGTAALVMLGGAITTGTVQVGANASLAGNGTINGTLVNQGIATVTGLLSVSGGIQNSGTMMVTGNGRLSAAGSFVNNGLLDIMDSPQTALPAGYVNNGTILTTALVTVSQVTMTGKTFSVTIQSYTGHTYQLQTSTDLASWQSIGTAQPGSTGSTITLTDTNAVTGRKFYSVGVGP